MDSTLSFTVSYDCRTDVLYISTPAESGVRASQDRNGLLWRYAEDGRLVGVTIMNFHDRWGRDQDHLADKLSRRFRLPQPQARIVVDQAMAMHGTH